jgi:hypothetical protein
MKPQILADIAVFVHREIAAWASVLIAMEDKVDMWGYRAFGFYQWERTKDKFPRRTRKTSRVFVPCPYNQPATGRKLN